MIVKFSDFLSELELKLIDIVALSNSINEVSPPCDATAVKV